MPRSFWQFIVLAPLLAGCQAIENRCVFRPTRLPRDCVVAAPSWCQDLELRTCDGTMIHARWCPHPHSTGAVLYLHGNSGELTCRGHEVHDIWQGLDKSVLIIDYPGYGRSEGKPSEAGCYAAAQAAYDWLTQTQGIPGEQIVLFGESLGGGVATELASKCPHHALVLSHTFTSIPDYCEAKLKLPVGGLMVNRFDNLCKLPKCARPVFVAVGECDKVIPAGHARRLMKACPPGSYLFVVNGARHKDPLGPEFFASLRQFLDACATPSAPVAAVRSAPG